MRSKASNIRLWLSLTITFVLLFAVSLTAQARDGTDGSELQIVTPEQLEIQLGPDWAGVEFRLRTDAGMYPGMIPVGDDGVLRLEIGGSSCYQLTCTGSAVPIPTPEPAPEPAPVASCQTAAPCRGCCGTGRTFYVGPEEGSSSLAAAGSLESLSIAVASMLKKQYGVTGPEQLRAMTIEALKTIRDNV